MKSRIYILFTVLLLFSSSCGKEGTANEHTLLPGVSFGMSVDEAKEIFPEHTETINRISNPELSIAVSPSLPPVLWPAVTSLLLSDIKVLGNNARVTLRFLKMRDSFIDGKEYTHDLGLESVYIKFKDTVDKNTILKRLEDLFDINDTQAENNKINLYSKLQIKDLGGAELEALRSYMSEWPIEHRYSRDFVTVDRSFFIDKALEEESDLNHLAYGYFNPEYNELRINGFAAACLYAANAA